MKRTVKPRLPEKPISRYQAKQYEQSSIGQAFLAAKLRQEQAKRGSTCP